MMTEAKLRSAIASANAKEAAATAMLAALESVQSSGANSVRNSDERWSDAIIARSAYDEVIAAIAQAKDAGIG